jgi:hypothetical protein
VAWESSSPRVVARESSSPTVVAWESSSPRVVAWGSSSPRVEAWGSSRTSGSSARYAITAVHRHDNAKVDIPGAVVVETPAIETAEQWADYYGATVADGHVTVYKALDDDFSTSRARPAGIAYTPGLALVTAPDWNARPVCGGGLHACAHPVLAEGYNERATRYVSLRAKLDELVVIRDGGTPDKVKAARLYGPIVEVDRHGDPLAVAAPAKAKRSRKAAAK